ncbi:MAG: hypothetical protein RL115_1490 [Bacteroidota bacterium]|jgi:L-ascorbate metabolism protein UlaG (beta-lactamase superfamily)
MKFTFYGHACFLVETAGKKILFDPFITHNEWAKEIKIESLAADYILISHGHADHIADAITIALQTGATVVCNWEIYEWLVKNGVTNVHPMNTGGKWAFDGFSVKCTVAQHSSSLPDSSYGGNPMGFIVTTANSSFYYSGDTALTLDMQLIASWAKLNFAILPIGDNFTMGYEDAITAAAMIGCKNIVGVHYDTFGFIKIDKEKVTAAFANAGLQLHLPQIGTTIEL